MTPSQQAGQAILTGGGVHAIIWNGSANDWIDLTPGAGGVVNGMVLGTQVGSRNSRAAMWHGTAASYIDMHVPGFQFSGIAATNGVDQVGSVKADLLPGSPYRAHMWHGTQASATDIHPDGYFGSIALALAGGQQGGWAQFPWGTSTIRHAALWSGSAASFVDLTPQFVLTESEVRGMAPGQQVGWARIPFQTEHAAMWHGTAASHIDLNPPGAGGSHLWATCGSAQVGDANIGAGIVAGIWFGTPESFVNLAAFLPGQWDRTYATSVVEQNGLFYVGGYGYPAAGGGAQAFYWVGVPAPGTGVCVALGAMIAARRRRGARPRG